MIRVIDLFCGAGGESTGIIQALGDSRYDLAAVNHWRVAIETHQRNHPQARHFQSDLQVLNPLEVFGARDQLDLLWASPECTHHSVARGGRPRSDQSRASAWLILKWLSELYVRRVILENVPEFVNWGRAGRRSRRIAAAFAFRWRGGGVPSRLGLHQRQARLRLARQSLGLGAHLRKDGAVHMTKDTCIHFIKATGRCRAHKPNCTYHEDGVCRAAEGRLQERLPAQNYGIRASRWSPARALRDGLSAGDQG